VKPESVQKPKPAVPVGQQDVLLAEKTVSNAEQRKADWAIMKEMTKYLWPKNNLGTKVRVAVSLGLLIGAKVKNTRHPAFYVCISL
jgi:ABC transporter ATM